MSRRVLLAAVGVLVIGGVVLLILELRQERGPKDSRASSPKARSVDRARARARTRTDIPQIKDRPTLDTPSASTTDQATTTDENVRDHRTSTPAAGKPDTQKTRMAPTRVRGLHRALRPTVNDCARRHPPNITGGRSRLKMELSVDITGERLSVHEAKVSIQGADKADALIECVRQAATSMDLAAAGQSDLSGYRVRMGFVLRP